MKLTAALPMTAPVPADTSADDGAVRRAPSALAVPELENGSAAASASLDQVASYVGMLHGALADDPSFYARLVKRGFLDSAIEYTRYALAVVDFDKHLDNDGFDGMIEGAVLQALLAARNMGTPTITEPNLADELSMARAAASNAARGLQVLAEAR
jgi:hypothetical protein